MGGWPRTVEGYRSSQPTSSTGRRSPSTSAGHAGRRHRAEDPQLCKGSFFPSILEPRCRINQALSAVVMEADVAGVSMGAVDGVVAALGFSSGISMSEVSRNPRWVMRSSGCSERGQLDHMEFPSSPWTRPACTFATPPRRSRRWPSSWRRGSWREWRPGERRRRQRGGGVLEWLPALAEYTRSGGVQLAISDQHARLVAAVFCTIFARPDTDAVSGDERAGP